MPPPTYTAAFPFAGNVDRWRQIEFHVSPLRIWTGAVDAGNAALDNPQRGGFHMREFHGVTPEIETTSHYFWSMAANPATDTEAIKTKFIEHTTLTFDGDNGVIGAQHLNMCRFGDRLMVDIHFEVGANHALKTIERLRNSQTISGA